MIIEGVDPRDTQWEVDSPGYRVYFWHQPPAPLGVSQDQMGWHCDEYPVSEATGVEEVLDWARSSARSDQTFTLYVEHRDAHLSGLVRLQGVDPTSHLGLDVRICCNLRGPGTCVYPPRAGARHRSGSMSRAADDSAVDPNYLGTESPH